MTRTIQLLKRKNAARMIVNLLEGDELVRRLGVFYEPDALRHAEDFVYGYQQRSRWEAEAKELAEPAVFDVWEEQGKEVDRAKTQLKERISDESKASSP